MIGRGLAAGSVKDWRGLALLGHGKNRPCCCGYCCYGCRRCAFFGYVACAYLCCRCCRLRLCVVVAPLVVVVVSRCRCIIMVAIENEVWYMCIPLHIFCACGNDQVQSVLLSVGRDRVCTTSFEHMWSIFDLMTCSIRYHIAATLGPFQECNVPVQVAHDQQADCVDMFLRFTVVGLCDFAKYLTNAWQFAIALPRNPHSRYVQRARYHQGRPAFLAHLAGGWGASVFSNMVQQCSWRHVRGCRNGICRHE